MDPETNVTNETVPVVKEIGDETPTKKTKWYPMFSKNVELPEGQSPKKPFAEFVRKSSDTPHSLKTVRVCNQKDRRSESFRVYKTKRHALIAKAEFLEYYDFPQVPKKFWWNEYDEADSSDDTEKYEYEVDSENNELFFHFDDEIFRYYGDCDGFNLEVEVKPFDIVMEGDADGCMFSYKF